MKTDFEQETAEEAELQALIRKIGPADRVSMGEAAARWKTVGKPLFSLGMLEDAGLIEQKANGFRTVRLELTDLGKKVCEELMIIENLLNGGV